MRFSLVKFIKPLVRWSLPALALVAAIPGDGAAYFLSMKQKGQLLLTGYVSDTAGNRYDVRIIPGYITALDFSGNQWSKGWTYERNGTVMFAKGIVRIPLSLKYFGDYVSPKPWKGIAQGATQACKGEKYLFSEFMWSGVGKTWKEYWGNANDAYERQSFGWWFAYPWAVCKGTVNTTLRYVFGTVGAAGVATYGIALRPAFEISWPVVKTGFEATKQTCIATGGVLETSWGLAGNQLFLGTATPITGYVWTTAVGTPMAFLGRAPTPSSADDWWVILVSQPGDDSSAGASEGSPNGRIVDLLPDTTLVKQLVKRQNYYALYIRKRDLLDHARDSTVSRLNEQIQRIYAVTQARKDTLFAAMNRGNRLTMPVIPESDRCPYTHRSELHAEIEKIVEAQADTSLSANEKLYIVNTLTECLTTYSVPEPKRHKRRFSKDPNLIIQDETKQIFDK
jgi:hypothetical protein